MSLSVPLRLVSFPSRRCGRICQLLRFKVWVIVPLVMSGHATVFTGRALLGVGGAFVLSVHFAGAQSGPASGLYEIISGTYTECCGFGGEMRYSVPNATQSFVRLTVDTQADLATMSFLGGDLQTVFSIVPCPYADPIQFSFDYGFVFSNSIIFLVDPGPPPYGINWHYTVSNSADSLQINGALGIAFQGCADAPTQFSHSNVVARLVPGPRMTITEFSQEGVLLFIEGHAGWTNVIEASTNLVSWAPIATNNMPTSACPVCPYLLFRDAASTNFARRFYRCFEVP